MRHVPQPLGPPHHCCITGRGEDPNGFIETGVQMPGFEPWIYVSYEGAKLIANEIGAMLPEQVAEVNDSLARSLEKLERLEAELEQANQDLAAYDHIESRIKSRSKEPA